MQYVKGFLFYTLMVGGFLFWFFVLVNYMSEQHGIVKYDCSLAEISPDFPVQVKEDCRRLLRGEHEKSRIIHGV